MSPGAQKRRQSKCHNIFPPDLVFVVEGYRFVDLLNEGIVFDFSSVHVVKEVPKLFRAIIFNSRCIQKDDMGFILSSEPQSAS